MAGKFTLPVAYRGGEGDHAIYWGIWTVCDENELYGG